MNFPEQALSKQARALYELVQSLPIVSPHGHCDPRWWAEDTPFPDPAELLIIPDHYVFRMLYSQGVKLKDLGVGVAEEERDARKVFQTFTDHWHCFLGTPSREWLEYTLYKTLGVETELTPASSGVVFDQISEKLSESAFKPRALFKSFNIEALATTDAAVDTLEHHDTINKSDWSGRIVPTFRPDSVLNPERSDFMEGLEKLRQATGKELGTFSEYLDAIRERRQFFKSMGATATDHDVPYLSTIYLSQEKVEALYKRALSNKLNRGDARYFYGHMLILMAEMSVEDGLVMQLHVGSGRNSNKPLFESHGPDMGADMPRAMNWVKGLQGLLNRVGNDPRLSVILFTLDESTYTRELGPMAGHWPCLRIGPPWWFHDSTNGIRRYLDSVVETAGYFNLAGFNDDTRAFLSIPARHDTWRRGVSMHLSDQVASGRLRQGYAEMLAPLLCRDMALEAYRLNDGNA
jgi:glucuronate isomerase